MRVLGGERGGVSSRRRNEASTIEICVAPPSRGREESDGRAYFREAREQIHEFPCCKMREAAEVEFPSSRSRGTPSRYGEAPVARAASSVSGAFPRVAASKRFKSEAPRRHKEVGSGGRYLPGRDPRSRKVHKVSGAGRPFGAPRDSSLTAMELENLVPGSRRDLDLEAAPKEGEST